MQGYKVVTAKEMARIEALALQNGSNEKEFIEQAGQRVADAALEWIHRHNLPKEVMILAGKGNKGADAFAAGLALLDMGVDVKAYLLAPLEHCKPLNKKFAERFRKNGGALLPVQSADELVFGEGRLLIDGLFGTGFSGPIQGQFLAAIVRANESRLPILSIDIPSGLDGSTGETSGAVIEASVTVTLGLPKIGFFLKNGWNFVGELQVADFGLPQEFLDCAEEEAYLPDWSLVKRALPRPRRNRHKYQAGFVIGYAGSENYSGAAILASLGALRGGAGIVKLFYPPAAAVQMARAPYEVIHLGWTEREWNEAFAKANAVFIGPGLGRSDETKKWLEKFVPKIALPVVLDADALIPSLHWPDSSIATPHRKEMMRLLGKDNLEEKELLSLTQDYCDEKKIVIVLKGAPTWVFVPSAKPFIIAHGDPGMATAGSGDVLTGLLAALLAQGCGAIEAALLGVMLHALAGERTAQEKTSYCMIAGDLLDFFPHAFKALQAF